MKTTVFRKLLATALVGLSLGCKVLPESQPDRVRHFTLSGAPAAPVPDAVQVRSVQLAGHLRSRSLAVRVAPNEVAYLDEVRWAESLDESVTQLLRARLGKVAGDQVVTVELHRCELVRFDDNRADLAATYTIRGGGDGAAVKRGTFQSAPRRWDGRDHGDLVKLLQDAAMELAEEVARQL